jgi:cystathionine beta-lyase/cystathionine gamma-synthase
VPSGMPAMRRPHWHQPAAEPNVISHFSPPLATRCPLPATRRMPLAFDTRLVRVTPNGGNHPLSEPIVLATTYAAPSAARHRELFHDGSTTFYRRFGNPTTASAARLIADLEGAEDGIVFGSGMGAISTSLLAILRAGDHVIASREIFAQTRTVLDVVLRGYGVETEFVDARASANVTSRIRPNTKLIYIETPSNPLLHIADIAAVARAMRPGIELYVDSTFASPALQTPLALGATLSLHSATKFLGGHSDVMGGVVSGRRELIAQIREMQILLGTVLDPHAAWLLMRGVRTLGVRVRRQAETALALARKLSAHATIESVAYPFLESDPGHAVASRQMSAGGGLVSFVVKGGVAAARRFADSLNLIPIATSLGGVETIVELPYDLDFEAQSGGDGADRGEPPLGGTIRMSVGLEDISDLWADVEQALG